MDCVETRLILTWKSRNLFINENVTESPDIGQNSKRSTATIAGLTTALEIIINGTVIALVYHQTIGGACVQPI